MFSYNSDHPHFTMESRPFSAPFDLISSSSSSPFFPFSPPTFNQDTTIHDLLFPQLGGDQTHYSPLTPPAAPLPVKEAPPPVLCRKRATRKDRHSKIVTAQGPRDRRMRLNLDVAPQFFDIQDMLGYDKASKTVQWLIKEAKESIEKLKASTRPKGYSFSCGGSSKSTEASTLELECEDMSAVSDDKGKSSVSQQENATGPKAKRVVRRPSRRASYPSSRARESRERARARARERAWEKKNTNSLNQIFSTSTRFEGIDEQSGSHDLKSSLDIVAEVDEQCSPNSITQCKELNNGGRVNELSVSILDYNNSVCPNDTITNLFPAEQWVSQFESIEDGLENRLW